MRVLIFSLLLISSSLCLAQPSIGPTNDPIEKFALELTVSPAAKHAELIAAHPELLTPKLRRELIQHGNLRLVQVQYAQALQIYQLAEKISDQIDDHEGVATARLNIGSVFYFQGNYDLAIDHYRKAETQFAALGNTLETARAHFGIALTYQAQQKSVEALKGFEESLKLFEAAGDQHEVANTLASIGGLQTELGNYEAASKTLVRAVELRGSGENLVRVADVFYRQHDYAQALVYYERVLAGHEGVPAGHDFLLRSLPLRLSANTGAANCYYHLRNYDKALWEVTNLNSNARVVVMPHTTSTRTTFSAGNALIMLNWTWFIAGTPAVGLIAEREMQSWLPTFTSESNSVSQTPSRCDRRC